MCACPSAKAGGQGVSTRSVGELVRAMGMTGISKSQSRPRGPLEQVSLSLNLSSLPVMAGLDPAIHVDPRDKPGDDGLGGASI